MSITPAIITSGNNDTGDKHKVANITPNFRKNLKWPQWDTQGPGANKFIKQKLGVENLVSDALNLAYVFMEMSLFAGTKGRRSRTLSSPT